MRSNKWPTNEKNQPKFTSDADGLSRMASWVLTSRKVNRVQLYDDTTARRLGVSIERLWELQTEVTQQGHIVCRRGTVRTWYGFAATMERAA